MAAHCLLPLMLALLAFAPVASATVTAAVIRTQPKSQNILPGAKLSLTVSATGSLLTYQWLKDGSAILGATGSTYAVASAGLGDAGAYTVLVGGVSSAAAVVKLLPLVTAQPLGTNIPAGGSGTLSVQATGSLPLSYHWFLGRYAVPGQTNASLTIYNASIAQAGIYAVQVVNSAGLATSAGVTVNIGPAIAVQPPAVVKAGAGTKVIIACRVSGTSPLSYQWSKDGIPLPNQTNASLTILAASAMDGGAYALTVTNMAGTVTSAASVLNMGPLVTVQPVGTNVPSGGVISLSVSAVGTAPLSYQWYCGRVALANQTNAVLTLAGTVIANAGGYYAQVRNCVGSVNSSAAQVNVGPVITAQPPAVVNVAAGKRVAVGLRVTGSGPLSYQWRKDGVDLSNQTGASLIIPVVSVDDGGTYAVTVANSSGSSPSAAMVLNVGPVVTLQPTGTNVPAGGTISLSVNAVGTVPLSYQWFCNRRLVPGQTNSTLILSGAAYANAGAYYAQVTNMAAAASSAAVQVNVGPAITVQPPTVVNVGAGNKAVVGFRVVGSSPLFYQWSKDGVLLPDQAGASLMITAASVDDWGTYTVTVANMAGSATSAASVLNVGPLFTLQPVGASVPAGGTISLSVGAIGTAPLLYQWYCGRLALPNQTNATLTLPNVVFTNAGAYYAQVRNAAATVNSAAVPVLIGPSFSTQPPVVVNLAARARSTLVPVVTGSAPLTCQWYKDGAPLAGATSTKLPLGPVGAADQGLYVLTAANSAGSVTSAPAQVNIGPAITVQPQSGTVPSGDPITLNVRAAGTAPLSYQWYWNGALINGATAATLTIPNCAAANAGAYLVVVTNLAGKVSSAVAAIKIGPAITVPPTNQNVPYNGTINLSVAAVGSAPLYYQWYQDGVPISGARYSWLMIKKVNTQCQGAYQVLVSNSAGSQSSPSVIVNIGVTFPTQPQGAYLTVGDSCTLTAATDGTGPISLQWCKDGVPIPGATGNSISIMNAQFVDDGNYTAVGSNVVNVVTSAVAVVFVHPPIYTWTGLAGDGMWNTPSNWLGHAIPNSDKNAAVVVSAANNTSSIFVNAHVKIRCLTVDTSGGDVVLSNTFGWAGNGPQDLHLETGLTNQGGGMVYLACPTWVDNDCNWQGDVTVSDGGFIDHWSQSLHSWTVQGNLGATRGGSIYWKGASATINGNLVISEGGACQVVRSPVTINGDVRVCATTNTSTYGPSTLCSEDVNSGVGYYYDRYSRYFGAAGGANWQISGNLITSGATDTNGDQALINLWNSSMTIGGCLHTADTLSFSSQFLFLPTPGIGGSLTAAGPWCATNDTLLDLDTLDWANYATDVVSNSFRTGPGLPWGGSVHIKNWIQGDTNGNNFGQTTVMAGGDSSGLDGDQLNKILFHQPQSPAINSPGDFKAMILNSGELTPNVTSPASLRKSTLRRIAAAGSVSRRFEGLFYDQNGVQNSSSGFLVVNPAADGTVTGWLEMQGRKLTFTSASLAADIHVPCGGLGDLTVRLLLDDAQTHLTGSVSAPDWNAALLADLTDLSQTNRCAGQYRLSFGNATNANAYGEAEALVDVHGHVAVLGSLSDHSYFRQAAQLSEGGDWAFQVPLYRGQGGLLGWLNLDAAAKTISGSVVWSKQGPDGFAGEVRISGGLVTASDHPAFSKELAKKEID